VPLHSGLTLAGDLVLVEKLAEGGQGHVWRALDTTRQRVVAVKVLRSTAEPGSSAHTRFLREAQHLASFDHPGLTALLRYDLQADPPWMAMELADGIPLSTLLKLSANFGRPLTPGMVRTIVEQVAAALAHAHARGVVHRDLKPSNVVVGERVRVVDFGIAKLLDEELTQLTTVMRGPVGTLGYLAPEQLEGHEVTPRTDLHALGVLSYVMLTGRLPWLRPGDSTADLRGLICQRVLSEERPAVREVRPELAPAVDEVLRMAMALDPAARLDSVEQLADLLGAALGPAEPLRLHASEALPFEVTRSDVDAVAHGSTRPGGLPAGLAAPMDGLADATADTPRATESGPRAPAPLFDDLIGTVEVEPALLPFQGMVDDLTVSAQPPEVTRTRPMVHLSEAERARILSGAGEASAAPRSSRSGDGSPLAVSAPRLSAPPLPADASALGSGASSSDGSALLPGSMPGMSLPPGVLVAGARSSVVPAPSERRERRRRWSTPTLVLAALSLLVAGGVLGFALRPRGEVVAAEASRTTRPAPAAIGAVPSVAELREAVVTSAEASREPARATPSVSPRPPPPDPARVTKTPALGSSGETPPRSPPAALVPIASPDHSTAGPSPPVGTPVGTPSAEALVAALARIARLEETWLQRTSASRADEVISIRDQLLELTRGSPEADSLRVSLDDSRLAGDLSDVRRLRKAAERARDAAR
jgi:serine/threonine protein kinase